MIAVSKRLATVGQQKQHENTCTVRYDSHFEVGVVHNACGTDQRFGVPTNSQSSCTRQNVFDLFGQILAKTLGLHVSPLCLEDGKCRHSALACAAS